MKKVIKNYLVLFIIYIAFLVLLVLSFKLKNAIVLFSACYVGGAFIAAIIYSVFKKEWTFKNSYTDFIVGAILSFILASTLNPAFLKLINRLYYTKENIMLFKQLTDSIKPPHKFIFAFDNSGAYISKNLNNYANKLYEKYKYGINDYTNNCLYKFIEKKEPTYKNLLKSRLCFDLIKAKESNNDAFYILKIGNPNENYPFDTEGWQPFNEEKVTNTIQSIYYPNQSNQEECYSNFLDFYKSIDQLTNDTCFTYTLFVYSDFIHDLNDSNKLKEDFEEIKEIQKKLVRKKIIQNLFTVPVPIGPELKNVEINVFPERNSKIKKFEIDSNYKLIDIPCEINTTKTLTFFYLDNQSRISTLLKLEFEKEGNYILFKENDEGFQLLGGDGDGKCDYQPENPLKSKKATIKYRNNFVPDETNGKRPIIEVIQDGINYLVPCHFEKLPDHNYIWTFPLAFAIVGLFGGSDILNWIKRK